MRRAYLRLGLVGFLAQATLALVLWLAADVVATRECQDSAFGLAVEGGGVRMTETGCVVDIPTTTAGNISARLPTLDEGVGAGAFVVGVSAGLWPMVALWRGRRGHEG